MKAVGDWRGSLLRIRKEGNVETDEALEKQGELDKKNKGVRKMAYGCHKKRNHGRMS